MISILSIIRETQYSVQVFFLIFSNLLMAQENAEVKPFDHVLNQFMNVRDFTISKDEKEAFFTIQSPFQDISQIAFIQRIKNEWSPPELMPFCDSFKYLEPFLSLDGKRLYFVSDRPILDSIPSRKDFDIWYIERISQDSAWSKPINVGTPVNSNLDEFYPSISENNNLYFTLESPNGKGKDDLYYSKWVNGKYEQPVLLNDQINSEGYEFNAFISPKEDFILFTKYNEEDGYGSGDLYIARKDTNDQWKKATNLGSPINTKFMEFCPFYDESNQTLYFTSRRNNLIPRNFLNVEELNKYISEENNGMSKIYKTEFKID
jgi:hypothetical protein